MTFAFREAVPNEPEIERRFRKRAMRDTAITQRNRLRASYTGNETGVALRPRRRPLARSTDAIFS